MAVVIAGGVVATLLGRDGWCPGVSSLTRASARPYRPSVRLKIVRMDHPGTSEDKAHPTPLSSPATACISTRNSHLHTDWIMVDKNKALVSSANHQAAPPRLAASGAARPKILALRYRLTVFCRMLPCTATWRRDVTLAAH
jgi:hypothetical protein